MPLPTGQWNIVSGGFNGILNITSVGLPGNVGNLPGSAGMASRRLIAFPVEVAGTLQLEPNVTRNIFGNWNESHQKLTFQYSEPPEDGQKAIRDTCSMAGNRSWAAHLDFRPRIGIFSRVSWFISCRLWWTLAQLHG